jgi:ABC-2 type transport system ATP-binding protein
MTSSYTILTEALTKDYPGQDGAPIHALRGVDLQVRSGEVYALLGPNGAGKTTTIGILTTLLRPTSGRAVVAGHDVVAEAAAVRRRIGVTFQEVVLDKDLTGRQVLDFHSRLYGQHSGARKRRIEQLAALVELTGVLDRKAVTYSGGMKRRLELARGLMTQPQVLFLDEPTQGLDPQNRAGIWQYIRRLADEQGVTLLLTTHYMEEAEALADRVGIVDYGRLVAEGTPAALVRDLGADVVAVRGTGNADAFAARLQHEPFVAQVNHHPALDTADGREPAGAAALAHQVLIGVDYGDRRLVALIALAAETGFHIQEIAVQRPGLGDVFLAHTGRALRD